MVIHMRRKIVVLQNIFSRAGENQAEVAKHLGYSEAQISRVLKGSRSISSSFKRRIIESYEVSESERQILDGINLEENRAELLDTLIKQINTLTENQIQQIQEVVLCER